MGNKGLDQFTAGAAEGFGAAEVGRVGLHEIRVKVELADQQAELIPEPGLAVARTIARAVGGIRPIRRWRSSGSSRLTRKRTQLFDRTKTDAVGFPQSAIDGASLSNPQFGAMHQGRNV